MQSERKQPASAAGAALTGGGSQQTGKEELVMLKTLQRICTAPYITHLGEIFTGSLDLEKYFRL